MTYDVSNQATHIGGSLVPSKKYLLSRGRQAFLTLPVYVWREVKRQYEYSKQATIHCYVDSFRTAIRSNMTMKPTENLSRNTEAVADSLAAMIKRELTTKYSCYDYDGYLNPSDRNMITADDRMKLVDWCYDIVDHCKLSRETVASAMDMVDRFLGMPSTSVHTARVSDEALVDPSKFQLLTIAALYTSIKINEKVAISSVFEPKVSPRDLQRLDATEMSVSKSAPNAWLVPQTPSPARHHFFFSLQLQATTHLQKEPQPT